MSYCVETVIFVIKKWRTPTESNFDNGLVELQCVRRCHRCCGRNHPHHSHWPDKGLGEYLA